jgi:hypothetical protein
MWISEYDDSCVSRYALFDWLYDDILSNPHGYAECSLMISYNQFDIRKSTASSRFTRKLLLFPYFKNPQLILESKSILPPLNVSDSGPIHPLTNSFAGTFMAGSHGSYLAALKGRDDSRVLYALQQLPLGPDHSQENGDCFKYLTDRYRSLSPTCFAAFLQATERESTRKTLREAQRWLVLDALAREYLERQDPRILPVLKAVVVHAASHDEVEAVLVRVREFLRWPNPHVVEVCAALIKPLIRNGKLPTENALPLLAIRPELLRIVSKVLLVQAEARLAAPIAEKFILNVLKYTGIEGKVIDALLKLENPPRKAVNEVKQMRDRKPMNRSFCMSLLKAGKRVLQLEILTMADVIEIVTMHSKEFDLSLDIFANFPDDELARVSTESWVKIASQCGEVGTNSSFQFIVERVKKSRAFWDPAVILMTSRENTVHLDDWCATVQVLLEILDSEPRHHLYEFLKELTMDELQFGHITPFSRSKIIQKSPQTFRDRKKFRGLYRQDYDGDYHSLPLRGWREIALLLRLAPPTPETLSLLDFALDIHERPFAQAFAEVLHRYGSASVIIEWLEKLFAGRHSRKILGFDILLAMIVQSHFLCTYFATVIDRYISDPATHELVSSKAMRVHRAVLSLSLPSSIRQIFDHPAAPVVHCPKLRGFKPSIPMSVSLPPQKPVSKIPVLKSGIGQPPPQLGVLSMLPIHRRVARFSNPS